MWEAKILVVEDEGLSALSIKSLLEEWGHKNPSIALSSDEALKNIEESKPDLILMDINLNEDIDGIDIANQLKNNLDVPIVYITAHSDEAMLERVKLTKPYGYIVKPFSDEELKVTVDTALYRHKMEKTLKKTNELLQNELKKRKYAEKELKKSEEKFRGIIEQSHDGITIVDKDGIVNEWNCGIEEITGYSRKEMLGRYIWEVQYQLNPEEKKSPELYNWLKTNVSKIIEKGNSKLYNKLYEVEIQHADGLKRVVQIRYFTIKTNNEKMIASVIRDVTEQKIIELELKRAKNNLEEKIQKRTRKLQIANETLMQEIAERKKIEKKSRNMLEFLQTLIDTIPIPIFYKDTEGIYQGCNNAYSDFIGLKKEYIIGKSVYDLFPKDLADKYYEMDSELFRSPGEQVYEWQMTNDDGYMHDVIFNKAIYLNEDNTPAGLVGVMVDVTDLKRAEEGKKREQQKLMDIIEFLPDATFVIDQDSNVISWNRAIEKMTGVPKEKILGKGDYAYSVPFYGFKRPILIDLILSQDNEVESLYDHVGREGDTLYADVFVPNAFGSEGKFLWGKASPLYDDKGNFVGAVESIRDISKRKNAERSIKEQFHFLQNLIDTIPYPIFYKDTEYVYQGCNKAFEDITGLKTDKIVGKTVYDVSPIELADKYHKKDKELFENPNAQIYEEKVRYADGIIHDVIFNKKTYNNFNGDMAGLMGIIVDITERKEIEGSIKRSEAYYKTIFENTGAAIFIVEEDAVISLVNAEFENLCGYSKEEIEGKKSWKEFVSLDYIKKMEEYHNLRRIDPNLAPRNYEFEFIDKYGNVKNVLTTVAMIPGTKKSLASLLDITDKKKAVNSLRESEARLKLAMDMAKLVHWEYDVESDMFTFDDQFYTLYGTTAKEEGGTQMSSGEYARKFVPPEESHIVAEETAKALETNDSNFSRQVEHSIIRADGEKRFIIVRCGVIKDDNGRTIKTYGANQDITERKNAEEEINKNLKRLDILNKVILTANRSDDLKSLLNDILGLVLSFMDFDGGGIYLIDPKRAVAKLESLSNNPNDLVNAIDNINIDEYPYCEVYIDGKSLFIDELNETYPKLSKLPDFKSLAVVPIYSKEKIIGSFNLVSKNKHCFTEKEKNLISSIGREIGNTISKLITEEKMKKLIAELKRSNDELQQFAYVTSHDLQEPLRTIASFTQLLERRYKDKLDSDADEFIDYIVEASIRMKQMILDLLEYSRVTKVEKKCKSLKVKDILINVLDSLKVLIKENEVEITYGNLPTVVADESQLFRVLQNLIENAIKFKKENESMKIHISAKKDEERKEYIFSVRDNGIGIEKQYFDRIFTIFQRLHTRDEYQGTGIGLSISKRIIENHGGRMWVESEPDIGSTFYFTVSNRA